ncbi:MAG: DUF938 domain-containing protein [bacterium]
MTKPFSQACENNKAPILDALLTYFADRKRVLEVGSGTGQHAVWFARQLPHLFWQTSDLLDNHAAINLWLDEATTEPGYGGNLGRPITLDVCDSPWFADGQRADYDAVFSANTCHIMPWSAVQCFIAGAGKLLPAGGLFCLYGPFNYNGQYTSASNAAFDERLKEQSPHQGIRHFEEVASLAQAAGMHCVEDRAMPANNRILVFQKISRPSSRIGMP